MAKGRGGKRVGAGARRGNANARKHGFYSGHFTDEEMELVGAFVQDPSLDDEIALQRVMNRRVLEHSQEADTEILLRMAQALAIGTGRVARLLRDKRAISGEAADGIAGAIAQALDELSTEWGVEL